MIVYVAGPYGADTQEGIDQNIEAAKQIAAKLWEMGHTALCPHANSAHFEELCNAPRERYIEGGLELLAVCDAIVMTPDWQDSPGAIGEYDFARDNNIPIWFYPDLPSLHPAETRCPKQARAFRRMVGDMYRTHLRKNADYSPANIQGAGEVGLATRIWDKTARLMNLTGFRIEIASSRFEQPKQPKHESIEDTLADLAVYAIIWQLLRRGVWGK